MTMDEKKTRIMAAINARGWSLAEYCHDAGQELKREGMVKLSERYFTGGNRKGVWVAA